MIETTALHKYLFSIHRIVMKYRSRTDITVLILDVANGGATKTKIMYKSFLSYAQLKEYLTMLLENELLEYEETRQAFRTTEKGLHLLQLYNKIDSLIPNIRTA